MGQGPSTTASVPKVPPPANDEAHPACSACAEPSESDAVRQAKVRRAERGRKRRREAEAEGEEKERERTTCGLCLSRSLSAAVLGSMPQDWN